MTSGFRVVFRRLNLHLGQPARLLVWVLPMCFLAALIDLLLGAAFARYLAPAAPIIDPEGLLYFRTLLYCVWSFLYFWIKDNRAARANLLKLAQAESAAREAEVFMLRAQVSPHFLFNAFNTVLANISNRPATASSVVHGLSGYFRYSLNNQRSALVTIGEEFDAMASYLLVEKERFRDSLVIHSSIDPDIRSIRVPGVFLQPILENALQFSMKTSALPRRVAMEVLGAENGGLSIEVSNSGRWVEPQEMDHVDDGGLAVLRRRLDLLYPGDYRFKVGPNLTGDGVSVRLELPARDAVEVGL
ncbi:MAG: histidine kinase [Opitutales bacterium]|nr:histidine kinase [Opitutales bacterium]